MQSFDILLYGFDKLCLILLNSSTDLCLSQQTQTQCQILDLTDLWSHEEGIELREHSEHLVCISRSAQTIAEP
jgi:hypothetical protein